MALEVLLDICVIKVDRRALIFSQAKGIDALHYVNDIKRRKNNRYSMCEMYK
jgi:hypothetical protein